MNLRQLRYLQGIAESGFNISRAAERLHTAQPGISRQIQLLEQELGVSLLLRRGNRITGVTEAGGEVLEVAQRMLRDADNLRHIGAEFTEQASGRLVIATTHIHARYVLQRVIKTFMVTHPRVQLVLRQGGPSQIAQLVAAGEADLGISSEPPEPVDELVMLPCSKLERSVITRKRHPLLKEKRLTLKALAAYPLITLDQSYIGGSAVLRAFEKARITPNIVLSAIDADVIKTYVELGLGIAILPTVAYEPGRDRNLQVRDASNLFEPTVARIEIRRSSFLRDYMYDFIRLVAPSWTREMIDQIMRAAPR